MKTVAIKGLGIALAVLFLAPFLTLLFQSFYIFESNFIHTLQGYSLLSAIMQTTIIIIGTLFFSTLIALPIASLLVFTKLRAPHIFFILILLPLALPPYVTAFAWNEIADSLGPIQSLFRKLTGYKLRRDYWFPEIKSMGGAIFIFTFSLYPYLFLALFIAFKHQGLRLFDAALTLGATPLQAYRRVALKLVRPALIAGSLPLIFETMNDIAIAKMTGLVTIPHYIINIWLIKNDLPLASFITILSIYVMYIIINHNKNNYINKKINTGHFKKYKFNNFYYLLISIPTIIGFIIPFYYILSYALNFNFIKTDFIILYNSLIIGFIVTIFSLFFSLIILYYKNYFNLNSKYASLISLGYAIPGTLLGLGFLLFYGYLQNSLHIYMIGTMSSLIFALSYRFITFSYEPLLVKRQETTHLVMAARTLGASPFKAFYAVEWPNLRPILYNSGLLIFIETIKELPLTFMLRPQGFETIATALYEASEVGILERLGLPLSFLMTISLTSLIIFSKRLYNNQR